MTFCLILVPRMVTTKLIKQMFPLHCSKDLDQLRRSWVFDFTARQPLGEIVCKNVTPHDVLWNETQLKLTVNTDVPVSTKFVEISVLSPAHVVIMSALVINKLPKILHCILWFMIFTIGIDRVSKFWLINPANLRNRVVHVGVCSCES